MCQDVPGQGQGLLLLSPWPGGWCQGGTLPLGWWDPAMCPTRCPTRPAVGLGSLGTEGHWAGPLTEPGLGFASEFGKHPETLVAPGLWCVGSGHGIGPAPAPWSHPTLSAWPQRGQSRIGSCKRPQKATKNSHAKDNTPFEPPSVTSGGAALQQHLPRRCQPRSRRCQALLHRPGSGSVAPAQRQRWGCSCGSRRDRNEQSHGAAETRARR